MCMKTLCEVMDSGIDDNSLFSVLAALAHHKNNKTGDCFPSIPTIIRTSRLSENTVVKSLKRLKALGYISWTQEPGKKRFYQIHLGSLPKCAPPVKTTPLKSEPSTNLGGLPPQNCGDTLPKTGGTPSPNLPPEPGSNQELNQEGNQESSLSRLGELPNADDPETLPYDEAPLFDDYPELEAQALPIEDDGQTEKVQTRKSKKPRIPPCPYEQFVELYETKCPTLPKIQLITETRKRNIKARWEQVAKQNELTETQDLLQFFGDFFDVVNDSKFLTGQVTPSDPNKKPFKASLEWLTKESNFIKVIERRYDN